jgi:hypothetical protein
MVLVGLPGTPARAQLQPIDALQVYNEVVILRRLNALQLTRAQIELMLPQCAQIVAQRAAVDALARKFDIETSDSVVAFEWALIKGEAISVDAQQGLLAVADKLRVQRKPHDEVRFKAMQTIWNALTPQQRALVESDEAAKVRQAQEDADRRTRDTAVRAAMTDVTSWLRTTDDASFRRDLADHTHAVAAAALPSGKDEEVAALAEKVGQMYASLRRMGPAQFAAAQAGLVDQFRAVLAPPTAGTEASAASTLMSGADWNALLENPRTQDFLRAILARMPAGGAQ